MALTQDVLLDENAFIVASEEMADLKRRAELLKTKLEKMYSDLTTALDTPAGKEIELTADKVLIEPIDKLLLVIEHISTTLNDIIGTHYYMDVFVKFEQLNQSINFN